MNTFLISWKGILLGHKLLWQVIPGWWKKNFPWIHCMTSSWTRSKWDSTSPKCPLPSSFPLLTNDNAVNFIVLTMTDRPSEPGDEWLSVSMQGKVQYLSFLPLVHHRCSHLRIWTTNPLPCLYPSHGFDPVFPHDNQSLICYHTNFWLTNRSLFINYDK